MAKWKHITENKPTRQTSQMISPPPPPLTPILYKLMMEYFKNSEIRPFRINDSSLDFSQTRGENVTIKYFRIGRRYLKLYSQNSLLPIHEYMILRLESILLSFLFIGNMQIVLGRFIGIN